MFEGDAGSLEAAYNQAADAAQAPVEYEKTMRGMTAMFHAGLGNFSVPMSAGPAAGSSSAGPGAGSTPLVVNLSLDGQKLATAIFPPLTFGRCFSRKVRVIELGF
jgi:hypothetical protein